MTIQRALSALEVKEMNEEQRILTGIATSPVPDRAGDVIDPLGASFGETIPLFLYHDSRLCVGTVKLGKPTTKGIPFEASIPKVVEPGNLQDRVNEAWQLVKYKLIAAVSVGFTAAMKNVEALKDGGYKYLKSEILELSLVPIPMQSLATINSIKSFDAATRLALGITPIQPMDTTQRAAIGHTQSRVVRLDDPPPGASGNTSSVSNKPAASGFFNAHQIPKGTTVKTIQERITEFESKRAATMAALTEIVNKSLESGETFDAEQKDQRKDLRDEIAQIDEQIKMFKEDEALMLKSATVVTADNTNGVNKGVEVRSGIISVKSNLPKGTAFTRYAMALAASKGVRQEALEIAEQWKDSTPQVANAIRYRAQEMVLKAAMAAGTTTDSDWAAPLVEYTTMAGEFIDLLRPETIIGKMPKLRKVPFNIRVAGKTQGSTVGWVGQGKPKPVSELKFNEVTMGFAKAAGIVVVSQELARFSAPSAVALIQSDMIATMAQFLDGQFIDPAVAAVTNVSPASITNGVTSITSTGQTIAQINADVQALFALFIAANMAPTDGVWIMRPETALSLSMKRTAQDLYAFPDITMNGGTFFGLPVITSGSVPSSVSGGAIIVLADASEIFLADDGGVRLDVSEQASLQMDSAPADGASSLVSLWQTNQVGIRCERYINWQRRRDAAVAYIDSVVYS